jgi:hypothetical protein
MEDVGYKVGTILTEETSMTKQLRAKKIIDGLTRKYPWWKSKSSSEKINETKMTMPRSTFEGKNTFV